MEQPQKDIASGMPVPMVAVLTNPHSTTNKKRLPKIRKTINAAQNVVHFELRSIDDIDEALLLFARAQPSVIIINGGDGTAGAVMAALLYRNPFTVTPPIAILPGGKTNMTAADLGLSGAPEKSLSTLLDQVKKGILDKHLTKRMLIEMDRGDGQEPAVGLFFGAASIVPSIKWCRAHIYPKGYPNFISHFLAFLVLTKAAIGLGQTKNVNTSNAMHINVSAGGHFRGKYSAVSITTLDSVVLGLKPYSLVGKGGLRFSCVEAGGRNILRAIFGLFSGKFSKKYIQGVHVRRASKITIETNDMVTLDGEFFTPNAGQTLTLRGDKSLTFVTMRKPQKAQFNVKKAK